MTTRTLFAGGAVFDGSGADPSPADVAVEGGRIVGIGTGLDGDRMVDCTGRTVLPGLFDCHTHVMSDGDLDELKAMYRPFSYWFFVAVHSLSATLRLGITTIRDAAGADAGLKKAVAEGLVPGPRVLVTLNMLSQTGGHADLQMPAGGRSPLYPPYPGNPSGVVDGPDEVRRKVREMFRHGADGIKVATSGGVLSPSDDPNHPHFREAELAVLMEEVRAAGAWAMAHAHGTEGIKSAIRAGIDSVEHGTILDEEAVEMMLARGTYLVPTLVSAIGVQEAAAAGTPIPPEILEKDRALMEVAFRSFRMAAEAGVKIAMGTDAGVFPHGQNLRELELMAANGLSPADALVAATRSAANLCRLGDELGTLEVGKRADLVVVEGDPYDFSTLRERIREVWKDGVRVVDRGVVDAPAVTGRIVS